MVLKTANDGTLQATLGKKLKKSVKLSGSELKGVPILLGGPFKEITFAIVPSTISLYIGSKKEENRLTIKDICSIEAIMINAFVSVDESVADTDVFEIWLWE